MTGSICAVAAPHASATVAAAQCVRAGGNAVDAAVAAAFALAVVQPHYTSIGGDLIALVMTPGGSITAINATGYAGRNVSADRLAARHGASMPVSGIDTVTVPGAVAGLAAVHGLGAALPWSACIGPAQELAEAGVPASPSLLRAVRGEWGLVAGDLGLHSLLAPGGRPLQPGQHLRQPQLAASLAELARDGPRSFYAGALAGRLVRGLQALGSPIDDIDLAEYAVVQEAPLTGSYAGHQLSTSAPNSQGFLLLEILGVLEVLGGIEPLAADAAILSGIFQLAARDRRQWLADPASMPFSAADLLAPGRLTELAGEVSRAASSARPASSAWLAGSAGAAGASQEAEPGSRVARAPGSGDTVAVVTADTSGRAVCLIQSVFHLLGSGILEPATGILLHNRGSSFALRRDSPNQIGARKRPAHTLMPVMVHQDGALKWVVGTMGGTRQPQIQTQLVLRLTGGEPPAQALAAPRWVVEGGADHPMAFVEEQLAPAAVDSIRADLPVTWQGPEDDMTGRAQIAWVSGSGNAGAVSDPRGEGSAQVIGPELRS